jgi:hypothetical protein
MREARGGSLGSGATGSLIRAFGGNAKRFHLGDRVLEPALLTWKHLSRSG